VQGRKPAGAASPVPRSAFDDACAMLGRRRLTEAEVRSRLTRKHSETEIEEAVSKLKEYRFLDDEALIADFTRERLNFSPRSAELICAELERRGIDPDQFQRIFLQEFPEYDELETARVALQKQFRASAMKKLAATPAQGGREKVLRFLKSRGFSYEVMLEAWEEFRGKLRHLKTESCDESDL
jgi:regulatory protein